jgi:hypothetical protein
VEINMKLDSKTKIAPVFFSLALLYGPVLNQSFVQAEMVTVLKAPVLISKAKADGTSENSRAGKTGGNGGVRNTDNTNRVDGSGREDGTNRINGIKRGDGTNAPAVPQIIRKNDGTSSGVSGQGAITTPNGDGTHGGPKGDGTN